MWQGSMGIVGKVESRKVQDILAVFKGFICLECVVTVEKLEALGNLVKVIEPSKWQLSAASCPYPYLTGLSHKLVGFSDAMKETRETLWRHYM